MARFWLLCTSIFAASTCLPGVTLALYANEAGLYDFVVSSAGHSVSYAETTLQGEAIVTSDTQTASTKGCFVTSRLVETGDISWRRNVCSVPSSAGDDAVAEKGARHTVYTTDDAVYTMDDVGVLMCWNAKDGALRWDALTDSSVPQILGVGKFLATVENTEKGDVLQIRNAVSGELYKQETSPLVLSSLLNQAKASHPGNAQSKVLKLTDNQDGSVVAIIGWVKESGQSSGNSFAAATLSMEGPSVSVVNVHALQSKVSVLASSVQVQSMNGSPSVLAVTADETGIIMIPLKGKATSFILSQLHPVWTHVVSISSTPQDNMIKILGKDIRFPEPLHTAALFRYDGHEEWYQWYGKFEDEETEFYDIEYCPDMDMVLSVARDEDEGQILAMRVEEMVSSMTEKEFHQFMENGKKHRHRVMSPLEPLTVSGETSVDDVVTNLSILDCGKNHMQALLSTRSGTTMVLKLTDPSDKAVVSNIVWRQEEGLGFISSSVFLDDSVTPAVDADEEDEEALKELLTLPSRLKSQLDSFTRTLEQATLIGGDESHREAAFGFSKVAVLLSQAMNKIYGIDTSGNLIWALKLNPYASHIMVHGTTNKPHATHGISGGSHTKEVLILSMNPDGVGDLYFDGNEESDDPWKGRPRRVEWKCIDGTRGIVHATGVVKNASPIAQVVPLSSPHKHAAGCHQMAMLLHEDDSITFIPNDENTIAHTFDNLKRSQNGMFAHVIDKKLSEVRSMKIEANQEPSSFPLIPVSIGRTSFGDERIVGVAYPERDEAVHSPCTILGDDSLLLKYLNPHLAVVVTQSTSETTADDLVSALNKFDKSGETQRKPMGVTNPDEATQTEATIAASNTVTPNLFVNVIDTVSATVLYRASHSNAAISDRIPVIISENWIIYAYFNQKTRRTDVGVLTLHEGMIDNKGITPFAAPDQVTAFSSMDAESKPVVLAKTFGFPRTITALGVTKTRGGISTKNVLAATGDDKIVAIDRRILDPRRPSGELKQSEKNEGLIRYYPMIPTSPKLTPTYNQTVHAVQTITSTFTGLESQSLILAFGGPDLFFTRVAPSKGFDVLPENFNRPLLLLIVIALLAVLVVVTRMSSKKAIEQAWS